MKRYLLLILLALMLSVVSLGFAGTIQIGNATQAISQLPINGNSNYSYSQQIYTQAEINFAGTFTKICFYYVSGNISAGKDWVVYMGHTTKTEFSSGADWEPVANLTQVFAGDVSTLVPAGGGWMEITLETPFVYNNVDNLIIAVDENTYGTSTIRWGGANSGSYTSILFSGISTNPDPNNPPVAYTLTNRNDIRLVFPNDAVPKAPQLITPQNGGYAFEGNYLRWIVPHGSTDVTGFDVYLDGNLVSYNQTTTYYILPADLSLDTHSWYVVARNNIGDSAPSEVWTFEFVDPVIIGDGIRDQQYPFHAAYGYGRSLGLYTAAQIGQSGVINSLGWRVGYSSAAPIPYKIYIKPTTDIQLTPITWADFISGATLVDEGSHTFSSAGWHNIKLDAPFIYTGGNLLIGVESNYGGEGSGILDSPYFRYTTTIASSHQFWTQNNSEPSGNGTTNTSLPNLAMVISAFPEYPDPMLYPTEWDYGLLEVNTTSSKTFTFSNAGSGVLTVTGVNTMLLGFFAITDAPTFPVTLATGQAFPFTIQYTPTAAGNHAATFNITHSQGATALTVSGECFDNRISNFPHLQNFDGTWSGSPAAPLYWTVINANNDSYTWCQSNSFIAPTHSAPYAAYGAGNTNDWLITPPINLGGVDVRAKWWDRVAYSDMPSSYKILVSTTTPDIASFTVELADIFCTNENWTEHKLNLDAYSGQTIYLAFYQYHSQALAYGLGIDDFLLEEIPTTPVFTYTPTTLDFGPIRENNITAYQDVTVANDGRGILNLTVANVSIIGPDATMFEFDPVNLPFALAADQSGIIPVRYNPTAIGEHSAILRMVYGGANYDVALNGTAVGEFAFIESFEDEEFPPPGWRVAHEDINSWRWDRLTDSPRTGEAYANVILDPWDEIRDAWLITPRLAPSVENHIFGFYAFSGVFHSGGGDSRFNVVLSTTSPDVASFTHTLATNVQTGSPGNYMRHTYDLSDYIGQNIYIGVYTVSEGWVSLSFDDFYGPPIVPEGLPGPVVEVTISGANAVLTWEQIPEASSYKVYASEDPYNFGPDPIATVNTNSYTLPLTAAKRFFKVTAVAEP